MNKVDPKQYTKQTILSSNAKRIEKVLKRYWSLKNEQDQEEPDIIGQTKKIFEM